MYANAQKYIIYLHKNNPSTHYVETYFIFQFIQRDKTFQVRFIR